MVCVKIENTHKLHKNTHLRVNFLRSIWKNLHRAEKVYTDMSVASVTNIRYGDMYTQISRLTQVWAPIKRFALIKTIYCFVVYSGLSQFILFCRTIGFVAIDTLLSGERLNEKLILHFLLFCVDHQQHCLILANPC